MSNPQLQQEALDAELQVKAAQAEYQNLKVKLQSDLMNQKASAATVSTDFQGRPAPGEDGQGSLRNGSHLRHGQQYVAGKGRRVDYPQQP